MRGRPDLTIVADVHGTSHDRRDVRACCARRSEGVARVAKWGGWRVPRMGRKNAPNEPRKSKVWCHVDQSDDFSTKV